MKKLINILLVLMVSLKLTFAQNEVPDRSLSYDDTWFTFNGSASDSLQAGDSIYTYMIEKRTDSKTYAYFYGSLDSLGGTASTVTVYLQNKVFQDEAFANIDTITWTTGADTTFVFETTTSDIVDYWRLYIIGADDEFNCYLKDFDGKFVK